MKKVILTSVLAVAAVSSIGSANAASYTLQACDGTAGNGTAFSTTTDFVKVAFTPKCSANVLLVGDDQTTYFRTGAVSTKGKTRFGGSSNGGGVAGTSCGATPCALSDATTAMAAAAST